MKEREGVVNINFFKKVWYSITKFEQYPAMATEGLPRAIKYLLTLMVAVTIFVMIGSLMQMKQTIGSLSQYIEQNIPDFTVVDGIVEMNIEHPIKIENIQYSGFDKIIVNPLAETTEQKEQYENDETIVGVTIFFFRDEIVLKSKIDDDHISKQNYTYGEFVSNYTGENISTFNKTQLVEYLTSQGMTKYYIRYGLSAFVYLFLINLIYALLDALEIAVLGWFTTTLARIKIRFVAIYNMAVYALTLPVVLNIIYIVVNYFVDFKITYFQVAYITIAYIYLAATIFILKDDIIKKMQEVEKIKQEQKKVREEINEQEENQQEPDKKDKDNENNDEDKKEDDNRENPEGLEA